MIISFSQLNWFEDMIYLFGFVKGNSMIIKHNDENVKVVLSVKMLTLITLNLAMQSVLSFV